MVMLYILLYWQLNKVTRSSFPFLNKTGFFFHRNWHLTPWMVQYLLPTCYFNSANIDIESGMRVKKILLERRAVVRKDFCSTSRNRIFRIFYIRNCTVVNRTIVISFLILWIEPLYNPFTKRLWWSIKNCVGVA